MLAATPARAEPSVATLARDYGLFGTWAVDCDKPASADNAYVRVFSPSPGLATEAHDLGPEGVVNRYSILALKKLPDGDIELHVIFQPGKPNEERQKLVLAVRDGTRRTMFNQPDGGAVRVDKGVVLAFGVRTPELKKCE
jgi:hypothetical protein